MHAPFFRLCCLAFKDDDDVTYCMISKKEMKFKYIGEEETDVRFGEYKDEKQDTKLPIVRRRLQVWDGELLPFWLIDSPSRHVLSFHSLHLSIYLSIHHLLLQTQVRLPFVPVVG
jgi:hypothetical protein